MVRLRPEALRQLGTDLLLAVGVDRSDAELVADHLVESGLLGHDTHSVLRLPQYVNMVREGVVDPSGQLVALDESDYAARLSGSWNFGPVTAARAMEHALNKVEADGALAVVTVRDCNHIARLGRFVAQATRRSCIALMVANGHGGDLAVAPFGGRARRLPTNPLCIGIPTGLEWPLVLDMTTSMTSGGDLRLLRNLGQSAPKGTIVDADGVPTTDVEKYYGPPPGAALPLGMPTSGHKGFGLSVLVDVLAGALSGAECSKESCQRSGNALFMAVLRVEAFRPLDAFFAEVQDFVARIKDCPTVEGVDEILLPGENAYRHYVQRVERGLEVDPTAWQQIVDLSAELGVVPPSPLATNEQV
jgi:uncharacterized oxidoreductase